MHLIPARKDFPAHHQFDKRFLFEADKKEPINVSDESNDLKWILLEDLHLYIESSLKLSYFIFTGSSSLRENIALEKDFYWSDVIFYCFAAKNYVAPFKSPDRYYDNLRLESK